jgi:hypothetical protein
MEKHRGNEAFLRRFSLLWPDVGEGAERRLHRSIGWSHIPAWPC